MDFCELGTLYKKTGTYGIVSRISTVKISNVGMESNPGPLFGKKMHIFFVLLESVP